jgi:hypothetical protein
LKWKELGSGGTEVLVKSMAKWMLGAAVVAGGMGLAATPAKAAEYGVYVGRPVAYVPPCPGPGYSWTAGFYSGGYWVPGRWTMVGVRDRDYRVDRFYDRDDYRRGDWDRGRDRDRHDRDDRGFRDHDRR